MELEEQVVSEDLAENLKRIGAKQDSYFFWYGSNVLRENQLTQELRRHEPPVSAFTVAELGEMLPRPLWNGRLRHRFGFDESGWYIELIWKDVPGETRRFGSNTFHGKTEADARAKMLIYLIEKNLINSESPTA